MSADAPTTRELEPALRHLAAHPEEKVDAIAKRFGFDKQAIWTWLGQHNGGRKDLPAYRIDSALKVASPSTPQPKTTPPAKDLAPNKPVPRPKPPAPAPAAAAPAFAPDNGKDPWKLRAYRMRASALAKYRSRLEQIARGDTKGLVDEPSWRLVCRRWFRTQSPAPAMVKRFLAWCDGPGRPLTGSAMVKAPASGSVEKVKSTGRLARCEGMISQVTKHEAHGPDGVRVEVVVTVSRQKGGES